MKKNSYGEVVNFSGCFKLLNLVLFSILIIMPVPGQNMDVTFITEIYPYAAFYEDGNLVGFAVELLHAIWRWLGDPPAPIHVYPWARGYNLALTEPNVMLFSMARTAEREKLFKWVGPIGRGSYNLVGKEARKNEIGTITSTSDAIRWRVGVLRSDYGQLLMETGGHPSDKLVVLTHFDQLVRMLILDRVDMICVPQRTINEYRSSHAEIPDLRNYVTVSQTFFYYAFSLRTSDDIVKRYQTALDAIDAERRRILHKYNEEP